MNSLLYAAGQSGGEGNPILSLLPFVLIIVVMYFFMIRPQRKKQKEKEEMLESLQKGDRILTVGGIYGTIEGIDEQEDRLIVDIGDTKVDMNRSSVAQKIEE